jgi:tRNA-splicing ligase RtcB
MNYGWAFRLATYGALRAFARDAFGARTMRLVVDSPHNSVYEEQVGGESAIVHRHNACRAYPAELMGDHPVFSRTGQPVLLPGTNRTSSYLCTAGPASADSLHSACHGAGTMVSQFADSGLSESDPSHGCTLKFSYSDAMPRVVEHLDDLGVDEALGILRRNALVQPVARMRPMAVLT